MDQHLSLLTLAVDDLPAARQFYLEGLGWTPALEVPDEIIFLQLNHGLLAALWGRAALAADMGVPVETVPVGVGFALAHNVSSADRVREVMAAAEAAGATILKPAQDAAFGGHHGYFQDPAGLRWEIAYNPGLTVDPDGTVRIVAVDQ